MSRAMSSIRTFMSLLSSDFCVTLCFCLVSHFCVFPRKSDFFCWFALFTFLPCHRVIFVDEVRRLLFWTIVVRVEHWSSVHVPAVAQRVLQMHFWTCMPGQQCALRQRLQTREELTSSPRRERDANRSFKASRKTSRSPSRHRGRITNTKAENSSVVASSMWVKETNNPIRTITSVSGERESNQVHPPSHFLNHNLLFLWLCVSPSCTHPAPTKGRQHDGQTVLCQTCSLLPKQTTKPSHVYMNCILTNTLWDTESCICLTQQTGLFHLWRLHESSEFLHLPPTYLQRMDHNPPLLLSVPLFPTFSNFQRLASFIVRTDNALQPPKNRCKSYTVCTHLAPYRQTSPHCIFLFHWQLHRQMWLGGYESVFFPPDASEHTLLHLRSDPLFHTTDLSFSSISFCCSHPCLFLSSKSSLLAPTGRIFQSPPLLSFLPLSLSQFSQSVS